MMPSGVGATPDFPPGKGKLAPVDKCTSRSLATAIAGAPALATGIDPIQLHRPLPRPATGPDVKSTATSAGAGLKTGVSIARKCVNGCASSPGAALITPRLSRYSGTRINTLRRNMVRVAAPRESVPAAAAFSAATCCCTSDGHTDERALI